MELMQSIPSSLIFFRSINFDFHFRRRKDNLSAVKNFWLNKNETLRNQSSFATLHPLSCTFSHRSNAISSTKEKAVRGSPTAQDAEGRTPFFLNILWNYEIKLLRKGKRQSLKEELWWNCSGVPVGAWGLQKQPSLKAQPSFHLPQKESLGIPARISRCRRKRSPFPWSLW